MELSSQEEKQSKQAKKKPPSESGAASPLCTPPRIGTGSCSCLTWSSPCVCGTMVSVVSVGRGSVVRLCHGLFVSVGRGIHGLCILCLRARPVSVLSVRAPGPRLPPVFLNRGTVPVRCSVQFSSVISRPHPARTLLLWPVLVVDLVDVLGASQAPAPGGPAPQPSALSTISSAIHVQRASQKEKRQI